jgi:hypothetical protein
MSLELDLVARMLAFNAGKAVSIASHLQVSIQPDALVICPVAMAGEDTSVHIVACGSVGQASRIRSVPDPRVRDDQYALFDWLGAQVEAYFLSCRARGTYPQIWVSSAAAADCLDTLADRLRYNRDNTRVKRFGELLSFATERRPIQGQQSLITATGALRLHFATGQQEGEDEHLGTLLTWIEPPRNKNVLAAVAVAELQPMGAKTDPEFDKITLEPLVNAYNTARRAGAASKALERRAQLIENALKPTVIPIYEATQRAIAILRVPGLQPLPALADLAQREANEFESFMRSRDAGYNLTLRDKPKAAAFRLTEREDAKQNTEAAVIHGDRVARARGRLAGHVLTGEVENPQRVRLAPWRFAYRFVVASQQRVLRVRARDELCQLDDPRVRIVVEDVRRTGRVTRVSVRMTGGTRSIGLPQTGTSIDLGPSAPDWDRLLRARTQLRDRLSNAAWTHNGGLVPPPSPASLPRPADPLSAVERMR